MNPLLMALRGGGGDPGAAAAGPPMAMDPSAMYPGSPPTDPSSVMQSMPGMTLDQYIQMLMQQQSGNPLEQAAGSRQQSQPQNPLLAAMMGMGMSPPMSMPPQGGY